MTTLPTAKIQRPSATLGSSSTGESISVSAVQRSRRTPSQYAMDSGVVDMMCCGAGTKSSGEGA